MDKSAKKPTKKKGHGFKVLKYKINAKTDLVRDAYIRSYLSGTGDEEVTPFGRTLQIVNLPPYCTSDALRECLVSAIKSEGGGKVLRISWTPATGNMKPEREELQSKIFPPADAGKMQYRIAYVTFSTEAALARALELSNSSEPLILFPDSSSPTLGLKRYMQQYNSRIVDVKAMKEEVNKYMIAYDAQIYEQRAEAKEEAEQGPDEEGWIKVTSASKRKFISNKLSEGKVDPVTGILLKNKYKRGGKRRKKTSGLELPFIYSSKSAQAKLDHLTSLKQRFEQDKKRIAENKAKRKPIAS